ncbi:MAG: N-6 DNA methylase [Phycisphaerales bacterium]
MPALDPQLRRRLETAIAGSGTDAITGARAIAEAGARAALEALAVHEAEPYSHIKSKPELTALRNRLRAHARQLGDMQNSKGEITINALVHECAYEHWHRMLFARFLAENNLLIDPQARVAVTLEECEDLAKEEKTNKWEIAGRFAQAMLPQIFRADDPLLKVTLPADRRVQLETILADLPVPVFQADDSLGWVYQFWQSRRKDEVNDSGDKITGETLPSVTQLFTEHYMVLFLLHNTIGAWHAGKVLAKSPSIGHSANSEDDLRRAVALKAGANGGYSFEYLRFVKDTSGWRPAAGVFAGWPTAASDLKILDPCCGSGHFVVAAFELLVRLRMEEEALPIADAVDAVIRDNLFGLEIDQRCTHITAFNLALAAWKKTGYRPNQPLPPLNIACTGIAAAGTREQWMQMIAQQGTHDLRFFFGQLHDLFRKAATLGSLINPNRFFGSGMLGKEGMQTLMKALAAAIAEDPRATPERQELGVAAQGLAKAAELLAGPKGSGSPSGGGYTLVVTNVPYLGRGKQDDILREHLESQYPLGKSDLATAFVLRCLEFCAPGGSTALVTPQNWLFLTSYTQMRKTLLERRTWNLVARLGPGAFETIGGHVVNVALLEITAREPAEDAVMAGVDVSGAATPEAKAALLRIPAVASEGSTTTKVRATTTLQGSSKPKAQPTTIFDTSSESVDGSTEGDQGSTEGGKGSDDASPGSVVLLPQTDQLKNPDAVVTSERQSSQRLLVDFGHAWQGIVTGDDNRYVVTFWETGWPDKVWVPIQQAPDRTLAYTARSTLIRWEGGKGDLHRRSTAHNFPPPSTIGRFGIAIQRMSSLNVTFYTGDVFDDSVAPLLVESEALLPAVAAYCQSESYATAVRRLNQHLKVVPGTLVKVPFDLAHWQKIANQEYPQGLPEPQSNDPDQWIFHGHPAGMVAAGSASVSPMGLKDPFGADRHASLVCRTPNLGAVLQVAVARLAGYRWPAELDDKMRLDPACRAWVEKCKSLDHFADDDGVVPLAPMRSEPAAEGRLRDLLRAAFGGEWNGAKEATLLAAAAEANGDKSPATNLDEWLKNRFFSEHCAMFQHRPFVWHIWDGRKKDGFGVLVHYHRLCAADGGGRRLLESITHGYLGDWIARQRDELKANKAGADGRLADASELQKKLEAILKGEPPHDIFVRWKPLYEQPIGWEPDINDGVRMNIRPFIEAGVLRDRVNVKWTKDRGKEPEKLRPKAEFPWFWEGDTFIGDRVNDIHLKSTEKDKARNHAKKK